ncbi:hypothetical protein AMJ47_00505 [Parcubacteria bacterium DG_72]|nr:MAG: hypothetical protein AMJ47_00505 [Parcubacteria bacterium DG_72]
MGGSTSLAMYTLLLILPALAFGLEKIRIKSIFYFFSVVMLVMALFTTATRSGFIALVIGILFFIFLYPKKDKKIIYIKIGVAVLVILGIFGAFYLKAQPGLVEKIIKIPTFGTTFERIWEIAGPILGSKEITFEKIVSKGRYSGWQVLWPALGNRPVLGYGPENLSIAFDKYYDPSIPGITDEAKSFGTGWWDRAHNIFLDTGITIGIPGLIIYLLLFGIVFYKLQKIKKESTYKITAAGIQATLISYFTINFFNFDVFSTYLLSFLLISYSLFLIKKNSSPTESETNNNIPNSTLAKYIVFFVLISITIWFIWFANINPLLINKTINNVDLYSLETSTTSDNCKKAVYVMDSLTQKHSFIDDYVKLKYIDTISLCVGIYPELKLELSQKAVSLLEEAKELRPYYTRIWFYSAIFSNKMIESDQSLTEEQKQKMIDKSYEDLKMAEELNPRRTEIFLTWVKTSLLIKDYEIAEKKADQCIEFNPESGDCYWAKALVLISLGESKSKETLEYIKIALKKGQSTEANYSLSQLIKAYESWAEKTQDKKYYEILEELYIEKIKLDETNFQNHATLAFIYAFLGKYDKAREEAAIVLELSPESRENVEAFLESLPQ